MKRRNIGNVLTKGILIGLILGLVLGLTGGYYYKSLNAAAPVATPTPKTAVNATASVIDYQAGGATIQAEVAKWVDQMKGWQNRELARLIENEVVAADAARATSWKPSAAFTAALTRLAVEKAYAQGKWTCDQLAQKKADEIAAGWKKRFEMWGQGEAGSPSTQYCFKDANVTVKVDVWSAKHAPIKNVGNQVGNIINGVKLGDQRLVKFTVKTTGTINITYNPTAGYTNDPSQCQDKAIPIDTTSIQWVIINDKTGEPLRTLDGEPKDIKSWDRDLKTGKGEKSEDWKNNYYDRVKCCGTTGGSSSGGTSGSGE